ncbi:MAG: hypothetical protein ACKOBS_02860 [Verrucomicrobiota bacterium]
MTSEIIVKAKISEATQSTTKSRFQAFGEAMRRHGRKSRPA